MASADEQLERTRRNFILGLLFALGLLSFLIFRPFLTYVLLGLLFVYLGVPLQRRLARLTKRPRIAAFLSLLLMGIVVVGPLAWLTVEVVETFSEFAGTITAEDVEATITAITAQVYSLVGSPPPSPGVGHALLASAFDGVKAYLQESLPSLLSFVGTLTVGIFILAFVLYYGLAQHERLVEWLVSLSPLDRRLNRELLSEISRTLDAVFLGHIVVSLIQGLLGGLGLLIFGVPHAAFWTAIMVVLALVPLLGAFLVWGPAAAWLFATGHPGAALGLTLWGALLVGTIDNFLRPKIVGLRADIHPVLVLVGVIGGLSVFGFIGFVLGPLVLSMFVAVLNFWREDYLPAYEKEHGGLEEEQEPAEEGVAPAP